MTGQLYYKNMQQADRVPQLHTVDFCPELPIFLGLPLSHYKMERALDLQSA